VKARATPSFEGGFPFCDFVDGSWYRSHASDAPITASGWIIDGKASYATRKPLPIPAFPRID